MVHKVSIVERSKGLYCELSFGKDKKDVYVSKEKMKLNDVIGGVFRVGEESMKRLYGEIRK